MAAEAAAHPGGSFGEQGGTLALQYVIRAGAAVLGSLLVLALLGATSARAAVNFRVVQAPAVAGRALEPHRRGRNTDRKHHRDRVKRAPVRSTSRAR